MVEELPVPDVVDCVEYIEAPEGDDGEYVEYIEPPDFHVATVEYYGQVNMESVVEENPWADMDEEVPVPDVVDDRSYMRQRQVGRRSFSQADGEDDCESVVYNDAPDFHVATLNIMAR